MKTGKNKKSELEKLKEFLENDIDDTMRTSIKKRIEILENRETVEK